ncbi:MAG: hypothetical protein JKY52_20570 [Flavobacteriales bacterium]|nr:hypothetical protein [Flavobacteriales bacterium]
MRKPYLPIQIYLLLLSLAFITACNGQDNTPLQKDKIIESKTIGTKYAKVKKTQPTINARAENVHCGLLDKAGNLWFGTTGHGVFKYDGKSFTNYTVKDGLGGNRVITICEDKEGNILFGTEKGISLYDGKSISEFAKNEDFSNYAVISLMEDKKGRLWVCTAHQGVYLYNGESSTPFLSNDSVINDHGLSLNGLNDIIEDKNGNIWFASWATAAEGACRYDGKSLTQFTEEHGINDPRVHCVLEDKNGTIWCGTRNHGVFRYDPSATLRTGLHSFTHLSDKDGPGDNSAILTMMEDNNGNLWFGTGRNGVYRYDGKSFKKYTTEDGLINDSVFAIVEDKAGNLWFGTRNVGLYRYDGKSFVNFSE